MPAVLVDTHAILWWLIDSDRLSRDAFAVIEEPDNTLVASTASVWETAIKQGLGKLDAPRDFPDRLEREGFGLLDVTAAHAWAVRDLPEHHRDPFDRIIVAQALAEGLPVVSADRQLDAYGIARLW